MTDEGASNPAPQDDLPPESIEARKRQARLNALTLVGVLLLGAILPQPYRIFSPFLFAIPLIISVIDRIRRARSGAPTGSSYSPPAPGEAPRSDPYSFTPRDPKDPRRYRPIG